MKCSSCDGEIASEVGFCPKCGTKVGAAPDGDAVGERTAAPFSRSSTGGDDQEEALWSGGYSGKAMVGSWLVGGLATVLLIVGCVMLPVGIPVFLGIGILIWLSLAAVFAYRRYSIRYELTTQRFIHVCGILTRTSDRIEMIDIDDVTFTQSIVERMFDVGTIKLSSSDRTHPVFKLIGIADVKHVTDLIDDARRRERRKRGLHIENI